MLSETRLDPTKTGDRAESLERRLQKLIVGQEAAIQQIVNVYQTYLAGLAPLDRLCTSAQ